MSFSSDLQDSINMMNHLDKELQSNNIKIQDLSAYLDIRRNQISELQKHLLQQFQSIEKHKQKNIQIQNLVYKLLNQDLQKMKALFREIGDLLKRFFKQSQEFMVQSVYAQHLKFTDIMSLKNNELIRLQEQLSKQKQNNFQLKKLIVRNPSHQQQKNLIIRSSSICNSPNQIKDQNKLITTFGKLKQKNTREIRCSKSRDHLINDKSMKSEYSPKQKCLQSKTSMKNIMKQVQRHLKEGYENKSPEKGHSFVERKLFVKQKIQRMRNKPLTTNMRFA